MHGIGIVVTELFNDLVDFLLISLENSVTNNFLESGISQQRSVCILSSER